MSAEATMQVLDRSMRDETFLDRFRAEPSGALSGYDLTAEEAAALRAGDERGIRECLGELGLATAVAVIVVTLP